MDRIYNALLRALKVATAFGLFIFLSQQFDYQCQCCKRYFLLYICSHKPIIFNLKMNSLLALKVYLR